MSVVVAMRDGRRAVMATDSQSTGDTITHTPPKMMRWGPHLVGFCGWASMATALAQVLPEVSPSGDAAEDALALTDALRGWLEARHLRGMEPDNSGYPIRLLLAHPAALYGARADLMPYPVRDAFYAMGSGSAEAMGALVAIEGQADRELEDRARHAVEVACRLDPYCGGEVHVEQASWVSL